MDEQEAWHRRVRREQGRRERLPTAALRLESVREEHTQAHASARQQGVSVLGIVASTGLGATRTW